jgi:hypothetical protein
MVGEVCGCIRFVFLVGNRLPRDDANLKRCRGRDLCINKMPGPIGFLSSTYVVGSGATTGRPDMRFHIFLSARSVFFGDQAQAMTS